MHAGVASKVVAASCGLAGFAIAIIAGLAADNPADVVLLRAMIAMIVCNLVGWVFGLTLQRVFKDSVAIYAAKANQAAAAATVPAPLQSTNNPQPD